MKRAGTLVELLQLPALNRPDADAYVFLRDGEHDAQTITLVELEASVRKLAAYTVAKLGARDGPVLLLCPPGIEYIQALFACFYSGLVAVPAYPPDPLRLDRTVPRLRAIAKDSSAVGVITTRVFAELRDYVGDQAPELTTIPWVSVEDALREPVPLWEPPQIAPDCLALLQYTSGSTAAPRGVKLEHAHIVKNLDRINQTFECDASSVHVSWLPPYHDMGLVAGLLAMLRCGGSTVLLSPLHFLQKPLRWLQAITRYHGTTASGPNFAFDLCVRRIPAHEREGLDLRTWHAAPIAAEPVRAETIDRFCEAFGPYGFNRKVFGPCYGLAEATLIVTGGVQSEDPKVLDLPLSTESDHANGNSSSRSRRLVGCGTAFDDDVLVIVDPMTRRILAEGREGEIWFSGDSVGAGYWRQPDVSRELFSNELSEYPGRRFLRTGDLGILVDAELYVTGRIKDLIIIRGQNVYPQDVELSCEGAHPAVKAGGTAAFGTTVDGVERLVITCEIDASKGSPEQIASAIRLAVVRQHDVAVHDVVLIPPRTIAKTSSGKIQRGACRQAYEAGESVGAPSVSSRR